MEDRRKLTRKYLMVYSRVMDRQSGKVLGYLSDMTRAGAMIISDDPMTQGTVLGIRIDLPPLPSFNQDHLELNVKAAWCKPDIDPHFYNIGFQFLNASEEEGKVIDEVIALHEFRRDIDHYPPSISELDDQIDSF